MMEMNFMRKENSVTILLALGLVLSMGCVSGQMQVFTTPLMQAYPVQGESASSSNDNIVYPSTQFQQIQPIQSGTSNTGTKIPTSIDRYDIVQFSHAIGDELAAINCYSGGRLIAHLYFINIDPLPGNSIASGENKIPVLYYQYNRYNDILNMLKTGRDIYLVYFDQNNARIESRNIEVPIAS
jgi:hypothetical protein